MLVAVGCDKLAIELKNAVKEELRNMGHEVWDCGVMEESEPYDYPEIAYVVAKAVAKKEAERGILICGTGIGMALSANKVPGAYAAVCHDSYSTERSILSNNCNIMCMGTLVIGRALALDLLRCWMNLSFKESPSAVKIEKYKMIEAGTMTDQKGRCQNEHIKAL